MDCSRFREVVFQFADGEMAGELLVEFRTHMTDCPDCDQRRQTTERWLQTLKRRLPKLTAPERLRQRILHNLPHRRFRSTA